MVGIGKNMKKNYNQNSLINFSNSFLAHFHSPTFHSTIKQVDEVLKGHQKVVVILFDGMGQNIVRKHLSKKSFIRRNYLCTINSTFPPTTTAATTGFLTGKYPIETGWMAWAQYFESYQRNIILFKNVDYNNEEELESKEIAKHELPIKSIIDIINDNNPDIDTFDIKRRPVDSKGPKTLKGLERTINSTLKKTKKCFAYFYFDSPDCEMHRYGIDSKRIHKIVKDINKLIERVTKNNPDTLFFTFADHGHINVKHLDICEHRDLYDLLVKPISFEKRTPNFFIKDGKQEEFKNLFNKYYGRHFILFTKQEVLDNELFGEGNINKKAVAFIGDFVASSIDKYALYASKEMKNIQIFKGHHAGMTKEELLIDVSAYNV